jgi:hypothetical protein
MPVWMGWKASLAPDVKTALTWDEWVARQQRRVKREQHGQANEPFSERELARLLFVRWLYQRGGLNSAWNDVA